MDRFIIKPSFGIKVLQVVISIILGLIFLIYIGIYQDKIEIDFLIVVIFIASFLLLLVFFEYLEVFLSKNVELLVTDKEVILRIKKQQIKITLTSIDKIHINLNKYESKLYLNILTRDGKRYNIQLITIFLISKRQIVHFLKSFIQNYKVLEMYLDEDSLKLVRG